MRFAKYHGTGNDFLMVEDLDDGLRLSGGLIAGTRIAVALGRP